MRIGIDLGGTNIAGGLVTDSGELVYKSSVKTDISRGEEGLLRDIADFINVLAKETDEEISCVGIGVPGHADAKTGVVIYCNNIPFEETDLAGYIKRETGFRAFVGNDANVAALAEVVAGAAKDYNDAIMITLGTGVGSGIIINKKVYDGCNGAASEIGHMCLVPGGLPCNCGRRGCFELYASATALIRQTREAMELHRDSRLWEIAKTLDGVGGKTAFDGMRLGDETACEVVNKFIEYLSVGIVDMINLLQPEAVIIGGGLSKEGETLLAPIRECVEREGYLRRGRSTEICAAKLGNDAGIIGAALIGE